MKIFITLLVLFFSSSVIADVLLNKIKLNDNVNMHFSKSEINKYQSPSDGYGNEKKYSQLYIKNPQEIFDDNYTLVTIAYDSNSKKIKYISGSYENLNNCELFRDQQIIINQENGSIESSKQKNRQDTVQDLIYFKYDNFNSIYSCEYFADSSPWAGTVDYKYGLITFEYSYWLFEYTKTSAID